MEFSSLFFVLLFLPVFIGLMWSIKNNVARNSILLISSFIFYYLADPKYIFFLFAEIVLAYLFGKLCEHRKYFYWLYLIIVVGALSYFKYGSYVLSMLNAYKETNDIFKIIMPLGISFYTFEAISYVSDVYYAKYESKPFLNVLAYLSFFPSILSGPILRYNDFESFYNEKVIDGDGINAGMRRFIKGFFKKIVIANGLAMMADIIFEDSFVLTRITAACGMIIYMLQIYYDFSSYSDMAIGIGKMIGFNIKENFDTPYRSTSIQMFWRRWHVSLGSWFRDYVYIPLGGNRVSYVRWIINTMIVWILTGIWHGSTMNFLLWGLFNGVWIIIEKKVRKHVQIPTFIGWIYTQILVCCGFLIFRANSVYQILRFVKAILTNSNTVNLIYLQSKNLFTKWYVVPLGMIGILPLEKITKVLDEKLPLLIDIGCVLALFIALALKISGSYASFIYFNF